MKELGDERRWCCFHPREMVVGVCCLCLNERLLVVAAAAKQRSNYNFTPKKVLPKIFALTNLLNTRSDIKHHKSQIYDTPSSPTPEDSFISIKFEENGVASWDKGNISKISHGDRYHDQCDEMSSKSVIEHAKPRSSLRWRRRISHLFQLIKRKRSGKADACHVSTKLERKKAKYGWIRILTKRRAKE